MVFNSFKILQIGANIPSVFRRCWLGNRKGIRPVKSWVLVLLDGDDLTGALHVL